MSMILDALKKADAERGLGELPGLNSRAVPGLPLSHRAGLWQRRSSWLVLATLFVALMALAWWLHRSEQAPQPGTQPATQSGTQPAIVLAAPPASPQAVVPPPLAADIAVPPPLPVPVAKLRTERGQPEAPARSAAAPAPVAPVAPVASSAPSTPVAPVLTLATLPPNLLRELPSLVVGGSMYSDNPADRMLLIDKMLLHEGDEVAPGLVLENLMPKAAILRYKGIRFRLNY